MAVTWGGLRVDLLGRILARLPCLAHRATFAAVCFNWRSLTLLDAPPPQLPWLLLPSAGEQGPSFFCLLCRAAHRAALPDDIRAVRWCSSFPGGWLVLTLGDFVNYTLHNLHTGHRIPLPVTLVAPDRPRGFTPGLIVHVAAPTQGFDCLAAIVALSLSTIAFWSPGMTDWSTPTPEEPHERGSWSAMLPPGRVSDVVYYEGHGLEGFHVLTDNEELLVYVSGRGPNGELTTRLVTYHFLGHQVTPPRQTGEGSIARYLVSFCGKLLMVVRLVSAEGATTALHVFRLANVVQGDNHGTRFASWVEDHVPAGEVVLGRCCSRSFGPCGLGLDGFYFLDDANSFTDDIHIKRHHPCSDMGWLPLSAALATQVRRIFPAPQVQRIFPERLPSKHSRAVWFFH